MHRQSSCSNRSLPWILGVSAIQAALAPFTVGDDRPAGGTPFPPAGYRLVWSDEFNGEVLDREKWNHRYLGPRREAINVTDTVQLDGRGNLVLTTKRVGDEIHTAMIGTQETFQTTFGYFECRVKFQTQVGHWSAFWLQSPTMGDPPGDPRAAGTEIDVFEYLVRRGDRLFHTLHWDYPKNHQKIGHEAILAGLGEGWHTVGVWWTEDRYTFVVDGSVTWTTDQAVSHRSQYLILSLEVGDWAGDIAQADLPDHLLVDYVRVYQPEPAS